MKKLILLSLISISLFLFVQEPMAHAQLPYRTKTSDVDGNWVNSPDAFVPGPLYKGFSGIEDLFITPDDHVYVVESVKNRVVELNPEGKVLRYVPAEPGKGEQLDPKEQLRRPEGVFVDELGHIYVADTASRRIVVFDRSGRFVREYTAPDSELLPTTFIYAPSKVVADKRGYMYIVTKGGYQGLLQLTPDGAFAGFFGANKVPFSWVDNFKRRFYTEEQLREEQKRLPGAITNMAMNPDGFLYTVNKDLKTGQLRQLNYGGIDLLKDHNFAPWVGPLERFSFQDVHVDENGVMTVIESSGGRVYQYDKNGDLMFVFGSAAVGQERLGLFKRPTSIVVNSKGNILISDGELGTIQTFTRTRYGDLVHKSSMLTMQGKSNEAEPLWKEIHQLNGMFDRAYLGMAKAAFQQGDYERAMRQFEEATDRTGYSEAFWQIRMDFLMKRFSTGMTVLMLLIGTWLIIRRIRRSRNAVLGNPARMPAHGMLSAHIPNAVSEPMRLVFRLLRHPVQGMYEVAESERAGWLFAIFLLFAGFAAKITGQFIASFHFSDRLFEQLDIRLEAMSYFLPWLTWVLANYLIGSVLNGEGTLRKVFTVNSYALVPYVIFIVPLQAATNFLTLQEGILYTSAINVLLLWMLILMFIGTQTVHNYNLKESFGMVAVSLFTLGCIWIFGFTLIGLVVQAADFFMAFGREVMERV